MQSQASAKVEAALNGPASELQHLAQLLSSQRLAAAVSLASAGGDVRLAMLICQVMRFLIDCNACLLHLRILQTWPLERVRGIHVLILDSLHAVTFPHFCSRRTETITICRRHPEALQGRRQRVSWPCGRMRGLQATWTRLACWCTSSWLGMSTM